MLASTCLYSLYAWLFSAIVPLQVEAMLGKFSLDTVMSYGGKGAGFFLMLYLFTMIVMIMNFFVAILNDFLAAVANSKDMQNRDFEVMDHFVDTVTQLIVSRNDNDGTIHHFLLVLYCCNFFRLPTTEKLLRTLNGTSFIDN